MSCLGRGEGRWKTILLGPLRPGAPGPAVRELGGSVKLLNLWVPQCSDL